MYLATFFVSLEIRRVHIWHNNNKSKKQYAATLRSCISCVTKGTDTPLMLKFVTASLQLSGALDWCTFECNCRNCVLSCFLNHTLVLVWRGNYWWTAPIDYFFKKEEKITFLFFD